MFKKLFCVFVFFIIHFQAQTYTITGKIVNDDSKPIENATVSLIKQKDSSIINFIGTNKNGNFSMKVPLQKDITILQISSENTRNYSKIIPLINSNISFDKIQLEKELSTDIEEVKITVSPVKIKKDTVEYNASYLKVKPDSKIDDLLKEIPGVETDQDGNITVNGKPINKILINGKPFFDKNGKVALETFPADIIKKIQITTSKTKEEQFTGRAPVSDSLTVNFNVDEKNNKGNLNNFMLGYGSNDRYESTVFMTRFKQNRNIALIAALNNINTTGFSVDNFFQSNSGKNSAVNGKPVNSGIMKTSMIGINYADKIGDNFDLDKFSLQYTDNNLDTYSKTSRTTFLPDYKLDKFSERSGNSDSGKFTANTDAAITIDKLTHITISMDFANTSTDSFSKNTTSTLRDDQALNSSTSNSKVSSVNNIFTPTVGFTKRFNKKGRAFSATISNTFAQNQIKNYSQQNTIFYQSPSDNDERNQFSKTKNSRNYFGADFKYDEPVSDSATVTLLLNYDYQNLTNERIVNDYDEEDDQYDIYNVLLSNVLDQRNNYMNTGIAYNLNKQKLNFRAASNIRWTNLAFSSIRNMEEQSFSKNFYLPEFQTTFQYKFSPTKSLRITNNAGYSLPTVFELNPYIDTTNPLVTQQGNPDLKSTWQYATNINYTTSDVAKGINFYVRGGFNYFNNDVVDYSYYDNSGKQYQSYANISGNKRLNLNSAFTKTYKWNGNQLKITPSLAGNYNFRKGYLDGALFNNEIYSIIPRLNFTLNLKNIMDLRSMISINYRFSNYTNYAVENTRTTNQNITLGATNYFLDKNLFIDNDFRFNANTNVSSGFNRNSYFWNASIGYQFYKKQMLLKFRVYDLLNQRQNITRTIGDNYIEDAEELILRRYFMFSLIMKFNKIGGK